MDGVAVSIVVTVTLGYIASTVAIVKMQGDRIAEFGTRITGLESKQGDRFAEVERHLDARLSDHGVRIGDLGRHIESQIAVVVVEVRKVGEAVQEINGIMVRVEHLERTLGQIEARLERLS